MKIFKTYSVFVFSVFAMLHLSACSDQASDKPETSQGAQLYSSNCKVCHAQGINGAPILGNKKMWSKRTAKGIDALAQNAINGVGLMPAKGGKTQLSDEEIKTIVTYMVAQAK